MSTNSLGYVRTGASADVVAVASAGIARNSWPGTLKGDLGVQRGDVVVALHVGHDGEVLKVNTAAPTGLAWGAAGVGSGGVLTVNDRTSPDGHVTLTVADVRDLDVTQKASLVHTHNISDIMMDGTTGLSSALAAKVDQNHAHPITEVTGLNTALAGLSESNHEHTGDARTTIPEVTTLVDGVYSESTHTHDASHFNAEDLSLAILNPIFARRDANNGIAGISSTGVLSPSVYNFSGLRNMGTWNALTNDPPLADGGGGFAAGCLRIVTTAGSTSLDGISDWEVGDWAVCNGTAWRKIDNTGVTTVNGMSGDVDLRTDAIVEGASNKFFTEQAVATNTLVATGQTHTSDASLHPELATDGTESATRVWPVDDIKTAVGDTVALGGGSSVATLTLNGSGSESFTLPTSRGSDGQILVAHDNSGAVSWQQPSTGLGDPDSLQFDGWIQPTDYLIVYDAGSAVTSRVLVSDVFDNSGLVTKAGVRAAIEGKLPPIASPVLTTNTSAGPDYTVDALGTIGGTAAWHAFDSNAGTAWECGDFAASGNGSGGNFVYTGSVALRLAPVTGVATSNTISGPHLLIHSTTRRAVRSIQLEALSAETRPINWALLVNDAPMALDLLDGNPPVNLLDGNWRLAVQSTDAFGEGISAMPVPYVLPAPVCGTSFAFVVISANNGSTRVSLSSLVLQ